MLNKIKKPICSTGGAVLPTKHPRLTIVLEKEIYDTIKHLARIKRVSMSTIVSDLLKIALELKEDILISNFVDNRNIDENCLLGHEETWEKKN